MAKEPPDAYKAAQRRKKNQAQYMRYWDKKAAANKASKSDGRKTKSPAHRKAISEGLKAYHAGKSKKKPDGVKALRTERKTAAKNVKVKRAARATSSGTTPKKVFSKDGGPWGNMGASVANAARAAGFKNKTEWKNAGSPNQSAMKKLAAKRKVK